MEEKNKLFVGSLAETVTDSILKAHFEQAEVGTVTEAVVIAGRGFGFVKMSTAEEAQAAIAKLEGSMLEGKAIHVNEARPQVKRQ